MEEMTVREYGLWASYTYSMLKVPFHFESLCLIIILFILLIEIAHGS
jgi:hypothetical protein